jgi:hypothetical protein
MDYNITQGSSVLTNSGDDFSGTFSVNFTALKDRGIYLVKMPITNTTTSPTLNPNGIGVKNIFKNGGAAINIGQLLQNGWYFLLYQSSTDSFYVLN